MNSPIPQLVADELRTLEIRLTQADVRSSAEELSKLLADGFREFGGSGREFTKETIISLLQKQPAFEIQIEDFRAIGIGAESALVTYRATCRVKGTATVSRSLRSSIWQKQEGHWRVIFHQGTPLPGGTQSN